MDFENKELLSKVINKKLNDCMSLEDKEEAKKSFDDAMRAISVQNESKKIKKENLVRVIEIGIIAFVGPIVEVACKRKYAKDICEFEKEYTWTTSAGKGISSLFRFKK